MGLFKKPFLFQERTLQARKIKKPTLNFFLYFKKWNFLAPTRELAKPEKQTFVILF